MTDDSVWEKKDKRIARMSCIKSAVDLLAVNGADEQDYKPEQVISIAREFEKYVYEAKKQDS